MGGSICPLEDLGLWPLSSPCFQLLQMQWGGVQLCVWGKIYPQDFVSLIPWYYKSTVGFIISPWVQNLANKQWVKLARVRIPEVSNAPASPTRPLKVLLIFYPSVKALYLVQTQPPAYVGNWKTFHESYSRTEWSSQIGPCSLVCLLICNTSLFHLFKIININYYFSLGGNQAVIQSYPYLNVQELL